MRSFKSSTLTIYKTLNFNSIRFQENYIKELKNINYEQKNSQNECFIALEKLKQQKNECEAATDWSRNKEEASVETQLEKKNDKKMCNSPRLNQLIKEVLCINLFKNYLNF